MKNGEDSTLKFCFLQRLLTDPAVERRPRIVAGCYTPRRLQRVINLKVISGLFVEVVYDYGDSRFRIIGSHIVIH